MKIVRISSRAKSINVLLQKAQKGRSHPAISEGREFILAEIDDFSREIELTRRNKDLMKLLDDRGKQTKTFLTVDVNRQLGID